MLKVCFFARLREEMGLPEIEIDWKPELVDLAVLKAEIALQQPKAHSLFADTKVLCAVNQVMVKADHPLNDGDEIAFFPPVTGG